MNIYICENDTVQLERMKTIVEHYIMFEQRDMTLKAATSSPEVILQNVQSSKEIGFYFLDIHLNHQMNGIQLASEIRKYDALGNIVFVTSHSELSYLTFVYKVAALDFILKDQQDDLQQRMTECLNTAYERLQLTTRTQHVDKLEIKAGSQTLFIDYDDILFLESSVNPHRINMHLHNRQIEFYGNLKDYDKIDSRFLRCHHSYIVNRNNIDSIDKKNRRINFANGEHCFVSIRNLGKL